MIWFFITMGEFWAWKTQNTTKYLKDFNPNKEVNISNYYTGYTDFQVNSHQDLINILFDVYDYHQFVNIYKDRAKLFKHKPKIMLEKYEAKAKIFFAKYPNLKRWMKFNIVLDESSIYFNPREFAVNFSGENKKLLDFIYQPRKLNLLFMIVVQNPLELDVKLRRLAWYYRKYYKGFWFLRWHKDYYFPNPEEMDFDKAEVVWKWINFNFYPLFPTYDYFTSELIKPWDQIYTKWSLFNHIQEISSIKEWPSLFQKIKSKIKLLIKK